jgi:pimeloyl-ACP methyl ester carboxylesterase
MLARTSNILPGKNNMKSLIARYKEENQFARNRLQTGSQLFKTSMGVVEAALIGHESAVLISHGSGGGYDMGLWLAQLIGGQSQYIAPSRFGYLRSPLPPNPTPETQADTYAALLDTLNVNSVIIIGLSAGGVSALQFALRHSGRCRGLVMISAASRPVPPLPPIARAIYPFMLKSDFIPWLFYSTAPHAVYQVNGVSRALIAQIKLEREKICLLDALYQTTFPSTLRREGMINDLQQLTNFSPFPIEQITVPTLVVHAINDPIMPFESGEFSARTIPNAQFLRLEDGGHFACVTHREETIPIVQKFLSRYGIQN